ncbi:MAG: flavin reductase family protein [Nitrososphaerota archaeon]
MTDFREFIHRVPQCVTVVSTYVNGGYYGMTVSSFTSVSFDPPLVAISLARKSLTCDMVLASKKFAINLLNQHQSYISDVFAYVDHGERFKRVRFRLENEAYPVLEDVLGALFCSVDSTYEVGDKMLIIGRVDDCKVYSDKLPLVYYQRQFFTLKPVDE